MIETRRQFLQAGLAMAAVPLLTKSTPVSAIRIPHNKKLGSIFNRDINGLLVSSSGGETTPEEYRNMVLALLEAKPHVLAKNVGMPDPVIYRSQVATSWDKHIVEVSLRTWPKEDPKTIEEGAARQAQAVIQLARHGTDALALTIEACRKRGVLVVASYRMNAEDWYANTWQLSDFGRAHPDWRIPGAGCLDPAVPGVFEQRMKIFSEVADRYDIDGIEFDFRRWQKMISKPLENHPILTRMVRQTRQMLEETTQRKRRERLLLGARVGPSLDDPAETEYPGGNVRNDVSCRALGLDVKTWIEEELVDYVCPSLFWPRLPGVPKTAEFVALAKGKNVGIYPTVFPLPAWAEDDKNPVKDSNETRRRHQEEIVQAALKCYEEGADGISTFNWGTLFPPGTIPKNPPKYSEFYGRANVGYQTVEMAAHPPLDSQSKLRHYLNNRGR